MTAYAPALTWRIHSRHNHSPRMETDSSQNTLSSAFCCLNNKKKTMASETRKSATEVQVQG